MPGVRDGDAGRAPARKGHAVEGRDGRRSLNGRFQRLAETARPAVSFKVDGRPVVALEGDTLLVALLTSVASLRVSDFGDGHRAGFCLMGACQDCWVSTREGERLRACTTPVTAGMDLLVDTTAEQGGWTRRV